MNADGTVEAVLTDIKALIVAHFGETFTMEDIQVDVDVFEGGEPLVVHRSFDSIDLLEVVAVVEEHFDVPLASVVSGDEPLTLATIARHIARTATPQRRRDGARPG